MLVNIAIFLLLLLINACFCFIGLRLGFRIIARDIAARMVMARARQNVGGDADEFLRLEGEMRGYEQILREGPTHAFK